MSKTIITAWHDGVIPGTRARIMTKKYRYAGSKDFFEVAIIEISNPGKKDVAATRLTENHKENFPATYKEYLSLTKASK